MLSQVRVKTSTFLTSNPQPILVGMHSPSKPKGLRQQKSDGSSPAAAKKGTSGGAAKRRKCQTGGGDELKDQGSIWENDQNIEEVFADVNGAARIERIFQIFGDPKDEYLDIEWFQSDSRPSLVSDQLNRPLQQSTVKDYERRIFESGLAVDCSGYFAIKQEELFRCSFDSTGLDFLFAVLDLGSDIGRVFLNPSLH